MPRECETTDHLLIVCIELTKVIRFRWAQLSMDHLDTLRTGRDIRKALREMPSTLNDTYVRLLQSIPSGDRNFAREALMWLCFAVRPLSLLELGEAIVLQEDDDDLDNDCRMSNDQAILEICQGLVDHKREKRRDEVTLAHDSIRTFLTSDWIRTSAAAPFALDPAECHKKLMTKSLAYLNFRPFAAGRAANWRHIRRREAQYPLLGYASQYWPIHAESYTLSSQDEDLILSFFATKKHSNGGAFDAWVQNLIGLPDAGAVEQTQPLYYAASYDMVSIIKLLLKREPDLAIDARGGRFCSTPLFIACYRGNVEAAKLLIEAGADPDIMDSSSYTCRQEAKHRRLDELVKLMEEKKPRLPKGLPIRSFLVEPS